MNVYAIGDVHGHAGLLDQLLSKLEKRGPIDQLWFVGDLVNRGPDSAAVIRRVRSLGNSAVTVMGNHDLALLKLAFNQDDARTSSPILQSITKADDGMDLLEWLRHRPLIHQDARLGWTMVHAGIPPDWNIQQALTYGTELETVLQGPDHQSFLHHLFGNTPASWHDSLKGHERLRYIANALTRMRFTSPGGQLDMSCKTSRAEAPESLVPWFEAPRETVLSNPVVFGHWAALERVAWPRYRVWGVDTGAAWNGPLSALPLHQDQPELIQVHPG